MEIIGYIVGAIILILAFKSIIGTVQTEGWGVLLFWAAVAFLLILFG